MHPATLIIEPSRSMKPRLGLFLKRVNEKAVKTSEQKRVITVFMTTFWGEKFALFINHQRNSTKQIEFRVF